VSFTDAVPASQHPRGLGRSLDLGGLRGCQLCSPASLAVDRMRDWFEMFEVYATWIAAEVVKLVAFRHGSPFLFPSKSMGRTHSPVVPFGSVAIGEPGFSPKLAWSRVAAVSLDVVLLDWIWLVVVSVCTSGHHLLGAGERRSMCTSR
jgi:hypothetical protein